MLRVLVWVILLGAVIYAVFWAINRRNDGTDPKPGARGPVGPDDDADFLSRLDWERRRDAQREAQREAQRRAKDQPPDDPPAT